MKRSRRSAMSSTRGARTNPPDSRPGRLRRLGTRTSTGPRCRRSGPRSGVASRSRAYVPFIVRRPEVGTEAERRQHSRRHRARCRWPHLRRRRRGERCQADPLRWDHRGARRRGAGGSRSSSEHLVRGWSDGRHPLRRQSRQRRSLQYGLRSGARGDRCGPASLARQRHHLVASSERRPGPGVDHRRTGGFGVSVSSTVWMVESARILDSVAPTTRSPCVATSRRSAA